MKYIILFFLFTFSIYSKERIVVLDFVHSKNVSREIAISSHNYFVSELTKTDQYSIIEKSQIKEVLKEAAFQQSGCTDTVCEIQIGEMLAADKLVTGNIIKKNNKHIITVTIRNVKDKSLEFSETIDLYDLNRLELTMNTLIRKMIPSEDLNLAKRNEKLDNIDRMYTRAAWRTLIFPGWGHAYWNEWEQGKKFSILYSISLLYGLIYNSHYYHDTIANTKLEVETNRILAYSIHQNFFTNSNDTILFTGTMIGVFQWGDKMVAHSYRNVLNTQIFSASLSFLFLVSGINSLTSIKKYKEDEAQFFSFSLKPESSLAFRTNSSYSQKGTHWEFSYSIRF